jgi:hypothetical protein
MASYKLYSYKVIGRGYFPADMLRYDCCWPDSPETVDKMLRTPENDETCFYKDRTILMTSIQKPRIERWNSVGWMVIDVKELK